MDLNKLAKECHRISIEKGFYDCPECEGRGFIVDPMPYTDCSVCKGIGKNKNMDMGERLALISSELYEALEAHRKNKFSGFDDKSLSLLLNNIEIVEKPDMGLSVFKEHIKDTFEDEMADVYYRILDLAAYKGFSLSNHLDIDWTWKSKNIASCIREIDKYFCLIYEDKLSTWDLEMGISILNLFLKEFFPKVDIEKHIKLKQAYNKNREYKHGKKY